MMPLQEAWLITGLPGAGKSTVAHLLAQTMPRAAVISGDQLATFLVRGAVQPGQTPPEEARRQQLLNVDQQCLLARSFAAAGIVPIMEYVVVEGSRLERYVAALAGLTLRLVVLNPLREVILQRDRDREQTSVAYQFVHLQAVLERELAGVGHWIDTSDESAAETVQTILWRSADASLHPPGDI